MRPRPRRDAGFSLIELVAVVVVIGALAAIAVPVYLSARSSAAEAAVRADLQNGRLALTAYAAGHDGAVPDAVTRDGAASGRAGAADLRAEGWSRGPGTADLAYSRVGASWCLVATDATGTSFSVAPGAATRRSDSCA